MMTQYLAGAQNMPAFMQTLLPFLPLILLWSIFWKGWALWVAARKTQKVWFVFLLVLNTLGILEILYLFVFSKKGEGSATTSAPSDNQPTA